MLYLGLHGQVVGRKRGKTIAGKEKPQQKKAKFIKKTEKGQDQNVSLYVKDIF